MVSLYPLRNLTVGYRVRAAVIGRGRRYLDRFLVFLTDVLIRNGDHRLILEQIFRQVVLLERVEGAREFVALGHDVEGDFETLGAEGDRVSASLEPG